MRKNRILGFCLLIAFSAVGVFILLNHNMEITGYMEPSEKKEDSAILEEGQKSQPLNMAREEEGNGAVILEAKNSIGTQRYTLTQDESGQQIFTSIDSDLSAKIPPEWKIDPYLFRTNAIFALRVEKPGSTPNDEQIDPNGIVVLASVFPAAEGDRDLYHQKIDGHYRYDDSEAQPTNIISKSLHGFQGSVYEHESRLGSARAVALEYYFDLGDGVVFHLTSSIGEGKDQAQHKKRTQEIVESILESAENH